MSLHFSVPTHDWINYQIKRQYSLFTSTLPLRLYCVSYNVAGLPPSSLLPVPGEPDIIHIGIQECVPLTMISLLSDKTENIKKWRKHCLVSAGENEYEEIKFKNMFGLLSVLLIHKKHSKHVHNVETDSIGTGMSGVVEGNKGAVGIRMQLYHSNFCFINVHLSHQQGDSILRNSEYAAIVSGMKFYSQVGSKMNEFSSLYGNKEDDTPQFCGKTWKTAFEHEFLFLSGDCNYHINLSLADCLVACETNNIPRLVSKDQLHDQRNQKLAFSEFFEMPITFFPTYKYIIGTKSEWDMKKGVNSKVPSYCDRIHFVPHPSLTPLEYNSLPDITDSDHKPVYATFDLEAKFLLDENYSNFSKKAEITYSSWLENFRDALLKQDEFIATLEEFGDLDISEIEKFNKDFGKAASVAASTFGKISNSLAFVSGDVEYRNQRALADRQYAASGVEMSAGDQFFTGVKRFGAGVADGVSGVFTKPYEGALESGATGFFKGVGIGIGGLFAKPAAGIFDFGMFAARAAANQTFEEAHITLDSYLHTLFMTHVEKRPIITGMEWSKIAKQRVKTVLGGVCYVDDNVQTSNNKASSARPKSLIHNTHGSTNHDLNPELESYLVLEKAAFSEPIVLHCKLHDNALAFVASHYRMFLFSIPEYYANFPEEHQDHLQAGIFTSLNRIHHNFGGGVIGSTLRKNSHTPVEKLDKFKIESPKMEDIDEKNVANDLDELEEFQKKDPNIAVEIVFSIPSDFNFDSSSSIKYLTKLLSVKPNEKFLELKCIQVDQVRLDYERATEKYNILKQQIATEEEQAKQKGLIQKMFGAKTGAPVTPLKVPLCPTKETQVTYRVSCWSKIEAVLASKLLNTFVDSLGLINNL